ncbi:MAG: hypothetical protein JWN15_1539 [Firmicutes bacterium]|nr:hypothetical protein [Bacillota bacterium]
MTLRSPNLDDRRYSELFAEARRLIPRYTPEWTDHNQTDPGITLLQLFSWLGEQVIYRLNQVPDKHYVELLRLIGVQLRPAAPARTLLTFKVKSTDGTGAVWLSRGSQVEADAGGGEPLIFETDVDVQVADSALLAMATWTGQGLVLTGAPPEQMPVGTAPDGLAFLPFGKAPAAGNALYLGFDQPLPAGREFRLHVLRPEEGSPATGPGTTGGWVGPAAAATRAPARVAWEWWDGAAWQPCDRVHDQSLAFSRDGEIRLRVTGAMKPDDQAIAELEDEGKAYCWLRGRLVQADYDVAPSLRAVLWNAVWATQAATVSQALVGRSDSEPGQTMSLSYAPVLPASLRLQVAESDQTVDWTEVPDLLGAGPRDRHYVLDAASGQITFGDGTHGQIPENNAKVSAPTYRRSAGKAGNVAAHTLTALSSAMPRVEQVDNPFAATGGADEEPLTGAMARAPKELKTLQRAVCATDYEAHALAAPGGRVARARVLPLTHPDFPGVTYPGAVTVVVVPTGQTAMPYPSRATLDEVRRHLDRIRTITTELYVAPPQYRQVAVSADVRVAAGSDPGAAQQACLDELNRFLHALTGGLDGAGWPWGGPVYYSDVFALLQRVSGVGRVTSLTLAVDGVTRSACEDITLGDGELVYAGKHSVSVTL